MDIGTLKIAIDTREAIAARRDLAGIENQAAKTEQATTRMAKQSNQALGDMSGFIGRVAGVLAAANLAQQYLRIADSVTVLNNQLKLAMGTAQAAGQAYKDLFVIAQQSRVSFTELGGTFAAIRRATEESGLSYGRLLTVTQAIGNAMAVSGGSAQGMNAALIQLQQGLSSGTLRGEELNSVMEQTPRLAQAIADGLGVTRGQLRAMGQDGKLTSEAVIKALESQSAVLKGEVASSTLTVAQAYIVLSNATTKTIGEFDQMTGASAKVAASLQSLGGAVGSLGKFIDDNKVALMAIGAVLAAPAIASGIMATVAAFGALKLAVIGVTAAFAANPIALAILAVTAAAIPAIDGIQRYMNANKALEKEQAVLNESLAETARLMRKPVDNSKAEAEKAAKLTSEMAKYASQTEKVTAEIARLKKEFGAAFTPEMEAKIRATIKPLKEAASEAQKLAEAGIELQKSLTAKDSGLSPEFAKQWDSLGAAYKAGKLSLDEVLEAQRLLLDQQPFIIDGKKQETEAIKEQAELLKEQAKIQEELLRPYRQSLDAQVKRVEALKLEEEALALASQMNISLAQAVEMVNIARLQELKNIAALAGESDESIELIKREIEEREKLVKLLGGKEARDASKRAAEQSAQDWKRTAENIERSLVDSLMRGFERGKDFGQNLKDSLENMFKTMVLRPIIQATIGGLGLGGVGAASASESAGGLSGIFSAIKSGGSIMDMIRSGTNLASGLGDQLVTGQVGKLITQFGSEAMQNMAGKFAAGMMNTSSLSAASTAFEAGGAQMAGVVAGSLLNGFAAYGISKALSGGYSAGKGVNTIAGLAGMIPGVGPLAGLVGAGVNRLFGRKAPSTTGSGITGNLSASGADVSQYQDWFSKGGTFRSDKSGRNYSAVTTEMDRFLDDSLKAIAEATRQYARILGLNADAINGVNQAVTISLHNLNPEQQQQAIASALTGFGDKMAEQIMGTYETFEVQMSRRRFGRGTRTWTETRTRWVAGEFVREGETAGQALARLAGSLASVNQVFDVLNQRLMETSLRGGDAASKLLDVFGGLENFTKATGAYYQSFYTEQERVAKSTQQLTELLGQMGLSLPSSRDAFRSMVEAQDLMTDSGRATYAALINLAPAFDGIMQAADKTAQAATEAARRQAEDAQRLADSQNAILQERIGLENQLLQLQGNTTELRKRERDQLDASNRALYDQIMALQDQQKAQEEAQQAADQLALTMKQLGSTIGQEITRLRGLLGTDSGQSRAFLEAQFATTTAQARAGDQAAMERLPGISQALEQSAIATARSAADIARMRGWLAGSMSETLKMLGLEVPQFAVGTNYVPQDTLAMIHKGEAIVPAKYNPANGGGMNEDLTQEIRALREEVSMLRHEARATAVNTDKTRRIWERVTRDGESMQTTVTT